MSRENNNEFASMVKTHEEHRPVDQDSRGTVSLNKTASSENSLATDADQPESDDLEILSVCTRQEDIEFGKGNSRSDAEQARNESLDGIRRKRLLYFENMDRSKRYRLRDEKSGEPQGQTDAVISNPVYQQESNPTPNPKSNPTRTLRHPRTTVIEVPSEDEDEGKKPHHLINKRIRSSISLLKNPYNGSPCDHSRANVDAVDVRDLIGCSDLAKTYQFNFSVDLELFFSFLHPNFIMDKRKIVFITGSSLLSSHALGNEFRKKFNVSEAVAPLPNSFASHHTKMMINFFSNNELEVIIMTCNLTQIDFGGLTQAIWRSGRLQKGKTQGVLGQRFRADLLRYLSKYGLAVTRGLIPLIESFDFSPVEVELIASAPGIYENQPIGESSEAYGYLKLRQVLERNGLLIKDTELKHNILSQVTSIAYPFASRKGETSSVFSHVLCPLMFSNWLRKLEPGAKSFKEHQLRFNYTPYIVFPTIKEIAQSVLGYLSGTAVHFKYNESKIHRAQYEQNVRDYLCKWGKKEDFSGRGLIMPHVKYYACDNGDDWNSLKWVIVGSHNLSKQAWGYPVAKSNGASINVSSYELSVLIPSRDKKLVPVFNTDYTCEPDCIPVRFPFPVPPARYDSDDSPWSADVDCGSLKDRWGNTYRGESI